jgi:hypothetical protein
MKIMLKGIPSLKNLRPIRLVKSQPAVFAKEA